MPRSPFFDERHSGVAHDRALPRIHILIIVKKLSFCASVERGQEGVNRSRPADATRVAVRHDVPEKTEGIALPRAIEGLAVAIFEDPTCARVGGAWIAELRAHVREVRAREDHRVLVVDDSSQLRDEGGDAAIRSGVSPRRLSFPEPAQNGDDARAFGETLAVEHMLQEHGRELDRMLVRVVQEVDVRVEARCANEPRNGVVVGSERSEGRVEPYRANAKS